MDILRKKLKNALKLNGYIVRNELCELLIEKLSEDHIRLTDKTSFDNCLKDICSSLEKQSLDDKSIEKENILQAIEACIHSGYDQHETVFNVISAFEFPNFTYDTDRKIFRTSLKKCKIFTDPTSKSELFVERYNTVYQKMKRIFNKLLDDEKLELQTVDYLLTRSEANLEKTFILGSLLLVSEGNYYLEDTSGKVQLDLTYASYDKGFFVENCFVLVRGEYNDKILRVATMVMPPGEKYSESKKPFGQINYFGGSSQTLLRDSVRLKQHLENDKKTEFLIFSDVWLDHPDIFEKLEVLFNGMSAIPPVCFIFIGNFMEQSLGSDKLEKLKKLFKQFGELVNNFNNLVINSQFVFVPGLEDPCTPHILPRFPLPDVVTEELTKYLPDAIFTTNPCRIQYCNREIVIFRANITSKLMLGTVHKPKRENVAESVIKTIVGQGHLTPMSLNSQPVHWDYDYTLRLNPLPDLVVIGDKFDAYQGIHHDCNVVNPGPFCENFGFVTYYPYNNTINDCEL